MLTTPHRGGRVSSAHHDSRSPVRWRSLVSHPDRLWQARSGAAAPIGLASPTPGSPTTPPSRSPGPPRSSSIRGKPNSCGDPSYQAWFPGGPSDPDLALIKGDGRSGGISGAAPALTWPLSAGFVIMAPDKRDDPQFHARITRPEPGLRVGPASSGLKVTGVNRLFGQHVHRHSVARGGRLQAFGPAQRRRGLPSHQDDSIDKQLRRRGSANHVSSRGHRGIVAGHRRGGGVMLMARSDRCRRRRRAPGRDHHGDLAVAPDLPRRRGLARRGERTWWCPIQ